MEQKKPTKAELERRINNSLVFVPKDKDYKCVYFSDKGLKLEVTQDHTIISTNYHKHIFDNITSTGISNPYIYTRRFIELAEENDCAVKDDNGNVIGYSYAKLINGLKENESKTNEYLIAAFCDLWFFNIFSPLYTIGNNAAASFNVYLDYISNIARTSLFLDEHTDGLTNKQFLSKFIDKVADMTSDIVEQVVFEPMSDEQMVEETMKSLQEKELEEQSQTNS